MKLCTKPFVGAIKPPTGKEYKNKDALKELAKPPDIDI